MIIRIKFVIITIISHTKSARVFSCVFFFFHISVQFILLLCTGIQTDINTNLIMPVPMKEIKGKKNELASNKRKRRKGEQKKNKTECIILKFISGRRAFSARLTAATTTEDNRRKKT